jgi:hypothetical protein
MCMIEIIMDIALTLLSAIVVAKTASVAHGVVFIVRKGGRGARKARINHRLRKPVIWKSIEISLGHKPLFHRQEEWLDDESSLIRPLISRVLWRAYYVIPLLSIVTLCASGGLATSRFVLASGVVSAVAASLMALNAVVRRFVLGSFDIVHWDLRLPRFTAEWAIQKEAGSNRSIYFLLVTVLVVCGFAALFCGMDAVDNHAFEVAPGASKTGLVWVYFSLITLATVGLGDVQPHTLAGQIAVGGEVLCGPVLLAWLIAMYLSNPGDSGAGPRYP